MFSSNKSRKARKDSEQERDIKKEEKDVWRKNRNKKPKLGNDM
jgi:hypothetical protein